MGKSKFVASDAVHTGNFSHNIAIDLTGLVFDVTADNRLLLTVPVTPAQATLHLDVLAQEIGLSEKEYEDLDDEVQAVIRNFQLVKLLKARIQSR
jgi:hypothetical protein